MTLDADRHHRLLIAAYGLAIALLVIARFNGINDVIHPFLQRAVDPSLYALSPAIRHSLVPGSSFLFGLIDRFHLDLTHPAFILPIYAVTCLLSGIAVDRISRDVFQQIEAPPRLFILFAALFADGKLINLNKSSWVLDHNFSFTFLAASLRFWFLHAFLSGRVLAMSLLLIPINILSFKVGWPITLMAMALLAWRREGSPLAWGALALSMVAPVVAALHAPIAAPASEAARIFDIVNALHASEDNPFLGPPLQWLLFPLGCVWAWRLTDGYAPDSRDAFRIGILLSLLVFLAGGLLLSVSIPYFRLPLLVLLSPARALETASLLIYLLVLVRVLTIPGVGTAQRCTLLMSVMILKLTPSHVWVLLSLGFLLLAALLRSPKLARLDRGTDPAGAIAAFAILAPVIGIFFASNLAGNRAQQRYDPIIGFYDHRIPADAVAMLRAIAMERPDRLILFGAAGQPGAASHWNNLARKSGIDGDPYYLPRLTDILRQQADNELNDKVQAGLVSGHVDLALSTTLARRGVSLVLPVKFMGAVPDWHVVHRYGSWVELASVG